MSEIRLDITDRRIINCLQGGFPLSDEPYSQAAARLDIAEDDLIERLGRLLEEGALSRFGPMFNAEKLGGAVTLCALQVPARRFDEVAEIVNSHRQVAHNYARNHTLNMWFVIASENPDEVAEVIAQIEAETGLEVLNLPKEREFFIGLKVEV